MKAAVCLYVRNEEDSIQEWLAYHTAIGFDTCFVYENESDDRTAEYAAYCRFGNIRVVTWSNTAPRSQVSAYEHCIRDFGAEFDWIAFLDSDEYLALQFGTVKDMLAQLDTASAVAINWAIFGSSGHVSKPDGLVIENFMHRAPIEFDVNRHVKSIIRPSRCHGVINAHSFDMRGAYVTPANVPVVWRREGVTDSDADFGICQINHYFVRSKAQFAAKVERGYRDASSRSIDQFDYFDRNEVIDDAAARLAPAVKQLLGRQPMRRLGPEALRAHDERVASGFIEQYLSGKSVLDIGYRGAHTDAEPITPNAIGVDLDYPGYDGIHLPFEDGSQDAVFASHCLEHIDNWQSVLADWYRVLKIGGFLIIAVPHQYLYERRAVLPSRFNRDHRRFYTPARLLTEIEQSLPLDGYRVRSLKDADTGFDYSLPPERHATGRYEIELVIEKIARPAYGSRIAWGRLHELAAAYYAETIIQMVRATAECRPGNREVLRNRISSLEPPPFLQMQPYFAATDLPMEAIRREIMPFIEAAPFNPDWYISRHPDIRAGVEERGLEFAHRHYVHHGYFEGRFPHAGWGK